jgi:hypothetical protein
MRNLVKYILIVLIGFLGFTSCKKEPAYHKLKFELIFSEEPNNGNSNFIEVNCSPKYGDEPPEISRNIIEPGYVWTYEYWELKDGDAVSFVVSPQLSYRFTMNVYVDGTLVSSRKIVTSDNTYYATITEEQFGLNNSENTNYPVIDFIYYE